MGFITNNIHFKIICGVKDNGKDSGVVFTFHLTEQPRCMIINAPTIVLIKILQKIIKIALKLVLKMNMADQLNLMVMC